MDFNFVSQIVFSVVLILLVPLALYKNSRKVRLNTELKIQQNCDEHNETSIFKRDGRKLLFISKDLENTSLAELERTLVEHGCLRVAVDTKNTPPDGIIQLQFDSRKLLSGSSNLIVSYLADKDQLVSIDILIDNNYKQLDSFILNLADNLDKTFENHSRRESSGGIILKWNLGGDFQIVLVAMAHQETSLFIYSAEHEATL
jgi:hypothetical protein